uniref:ATP synthase F0 subunit 8 n=1 Tax=Amusium pleuronectes TaxID=158443 RepID=A0A7U0IZ90_9BIVA|nr:ATP synthase F0 subunit 8 [Amusium pleuronectes]QQV73586.1 ATP synthase F0 subunit 8 [Amusium pleuronectes]
MLWLLWFVVILLFSCAFFCVMWWVHIPRTFMGKVKKVSSPVFKW